MIIKALNYEIQLVYLLLLLFFAILPALALTASMTAAGQTSPEFSTIVDAGVQVARTNYSALPLAA